MTLTTFKQYVAEQEATTVGFTTWVKSAPKDYAKWVAYRNALLAGQNPAVPSMVTHQGKALVLSAQAMMVPVVAPTSPYPTPDASFKKIKPGDKIDPQNGDKLWLLPGTHGEIYVQGVSNVEIIGDPSGGVITGPINRSGCHKVNVRNVDVLLGTILPVHCYGACDSCQTTNVNVYKCGDSGFMDEDGTNVLYDYCTSRDSGQATDGPGYPPHGMYMRCSGLIQNVKMYNAFGGGISLRRQGMTLKNALCDSKCNIGLSFYSFTTGPGEIDVIDSTFGGTVADVWISDEFNGPTPSINTPVGPHPTFKFQNVSYSGKSRDGFNYGAGIAANILVKDIHNLNALVA